MTKIMIKKSLRAYITAGQLIFFVLLHGKAIRLALFQALEHMNYSISKIIPYVRRYVLLGIYDVLDGERVPYQKKEDTVVAKAEVYGNLSTFSISAEEQEMGTELKVTMLQSCVGLSEQGKERAMTAVMDRIVQYLENELLMNNRAAIIMPQEDKYG